MAPVAPGQLLLLPFLLAVAPHFTSGDSLKWQFGYFSDAKCEEGLGEQTTPVKQSVYGNCMTFEVDGGHVSYRISRNTTHPSASCLIDEAGWITNLEEYPASGCGNVTTAIHRTGIYKDGVCSSVGGFFQKLNCNAKAEDMPPREPWIRSSWWWPLLMACACCLLLAFCAYGVCPVWENKEQKRAVGTVSTAGP